MFDPNFLRVTTILLPALAVACTSSGTRPHDASEAQHESAAVREDRAATNARTQYDPNACYEACWTDVSNPTSQYLTEAKHHEELAARHRAASRALRDAESAACVGVLPRDRDISPFAHRGDIVSVGPTREPGQPEVGGAVVVVFRGVPGMTADSLQRIIDCHIARNAALGHDLGADADCPLVPKGATARTRQTREGIEVVVRGDDPSAAREVWRRASSLASR